MQSEDISATVDLLERIVVEGTRAEVAEIVGHLERLKFLAWNREHARDNEALSRPADEPDRYLTIREVATHLGLSKSYCYELARRGILPVTALGKTGDRAFRIKFSELSAWEAALKKSSIDVGLNNMLSSPRYDGNRAPAAPTAPPDDPSATRRGARRPCNHPVAVGTRPGPRPRSRRPTAGTADVGQADGAA